MYGKDAMYGIFAGKDFAAAFNPAIRAPNVGETVLVDIGSEINGSRVHPAIVTRVFGPFCANLKVLADGPDNLWRTSVMHKSQIPPPSNYMQSRPTYWYRPYEGGPIA